MRKITDHIVSGDQAVQLEITVADEPGAGGANHCYQISGVNEESNPSNGYAALPRILFQNGSIKEAGVNGITQEALAAIIIDRLRSFQAGPYACADNEEALNHFVQGLRSLQNRTRTRINRGVEGTHTV